MEEQKWLDRYPDQPLEEVLALSPEYSTESILMAIDNEIEQKGFWIGEENLTEEERIVLGIRALELEVGNGGYQQFFTNSSKEYAPKIVDWLSRIDCPKTAEITKKAIECLRAKNLKPQTLEKIFDQEDTVRDRNIDRYGDMYFESDEVVPDKLFAFIAANKHRIEPRYQRKTSI